MSSFKIAGVTLHPFPSEYQDELREVKIRISLASIMFSYTLSKVELFLAEDINGSGSPAAAIVHGNRNIICFTKDGWEKFCTTTQERAFILVHELYHIFFQHHGRRVDMNYHPLIWNYATDYYINLKASGVYSDYDGRRKEDERYAKHFHLPKAGGLYDEKYLGMSCDDIYDSLVEDMKNNDDPDAQPIDMSGYTGGYGSCDDPSKLGENGSYSDVIGDGGTETHRRENQQTLASAATASKMSMDSSQLAGSVEGDMVRMVEGMMKPVIPWQDKFQNAIRSKVKVRTSYNKWNKMSAVADEGGIIFPSYMGEKVNLVYGIDSSGSMSEECHLEAKSELFGIISSLDGWRVTALCCDTELHEMGTYSNEDGDAWEDIPFQVRGLGGTILSPILDKTEELMETESDEINATVIVTDGYFDGEELDQRIAQIGDSMEVIVVVVRGGDKSFTLQNAEVIHIQ